MNNNFSAKDFVLNINNMDINLTLYEPQNRPSKHTICIYFHGGGLIFGKRKDLPSIGIDILTNAGYSIMAVDYPLLPKYSISEIIECSSKVVNYIKKEYKHHEIVLFGRSAGAYLSLLVASKSKVKGIISFYGYFNLLDPDLTGVSHYYRKFPLVDIRQLDKLMTTPDLTNDQRYILYLGLRQQGKWSHLIQSDSNQTSLVNLNKRQIETLPPIFLTHATEDPDVPVSQSRRINQWNPDSIYYEYQTNTHDFDRVSPNLAYQIYSKLVRWLDNLVSDF